MKKLDEAGLEICAYKQRIVDLIRSEDMLRALKTFEEMEGKNMPVDMTTVQMVSAVVSGERLELQEGAAEGKSGAKAAPRAGGQSALDNPSEAGAAAMRIYGKYVKSNATGGHLVPESVYTNVVRALCLAGRADEALEVIADLKASSHRPRLRTFAAPLAALASEDRLEDCFTVWEDALSENITLLEPEYLSLIRACAGKGGDYASFQRVMASYAEDVLLPEDPSSWDLIRKWFAAAGCWSVQGRLYA
jgi:pentatricopeptide repeat protein